MKKCFKNVVYLIGVFVSSNSHASNLPVSCDDFISAIYRNSAVEISNLISAGGDVNCTSTTQSRPLTFACGRGNLVDISVIKLLLDSGADPNAVADADYSFIGSPLAHIFGGAGNNISSSDFLRADLLISHGASVREPQNLLIRYFGGGVDIGFHDGRYSSQLLDYLIKNKAIQSDLDDALIALSSRRGSYRGELFYLLKEKVDLLISRGAQPKVGLGPILLLASIKYFNLDFFNYLLGQGQALGQVFKEDFFLEWKNCYSCGRDSLRAYKGHGLLLGSLSFIRSWELYSPDELNLDSRTIFLQLINEKTISLSEKGLGLYILIKKYRDYVGYSPSTPVRPDVLALIHSFIKSGIDLRTKYDHGSTTICDIISDHFQLNQVFQDAGGCI